jgi:hypothetical protein
VALEAGGEPLSSTTTIPAILTGDRGLKRAATDEVAGAKTEEVVQEPISTRTLAYWPSSSPVAVRPLSSEKSVSIIDRIRVYNRHATSRHATHCRQANKKGRRRTPSGPSKLPPLGSLAEAKRRRDSRRGDRRGCRLNRRAAPEDCPSWDRTRTLLIQSRAQRVCLEDTMSVSGCPPSIGARGLGGQYPVRSGETLSKRL